MYSRHPGSLSGVRFPPLLNQPTNLPTHTRGYPSSTRTSIRTNLTINPSRTRTGTIPNYFNQDLDKDLGTPPGPGRTRTWTTGATYSNPDLDKLKATLPSPAWTSINTWHPYQNLKKDLGRKELPNQPGPGLQDITTPTRT